MNGYLQWYRNIAPFYRILVAGALLVGIIALTTGITTDNAVFLLLGGMWIVGGCGVALLASRFDPE